MSFTGTMSYNGETWAHQAFPDGYSFVFEPVSVPFSGAVNRALIGSWTPENEWDMPNEDNYLIDVIQLSAHI